MTTIEERVKRLVAEQFGLDPARVTAEASFVGDLGLGDLDVIEVVVSLEDEFGVHISDETAKRIRTVRHAVDCVESRLAKH
ncbi:acyl carrier protein [Actinomadura namibiensis]|uniref:Acyl carrier protein n=1 Tax=Actinomadura namibiensis TaxID=182080 RepID=A0A7W3LYZ9_ACTNM|nr:acyl carrier protein [Actinomadura namibiensis]MBA8956790.1 acyl carrier protein [Actinomadura namibiensis]